MYKTCTKCKTTKLKSEFYNDKYTKDGLRCSCRQCGKNYFKIRRENNQKAPTILHDEKQCVKCKILKNLTEFAKGHCSDGLRGDCKQCNKAYREQNASRISKYLELYRAREEFKEQKNKYHRDNHNRRKDSDVQYKLAKNLRSRLWAAIRKGYKSGSAVKDLGCSILQLKEYLETMFSNGMAWDNWGKLWEIDHIIPLAYFDLTDRSQFLQANHYTNLRPLETKLNQYKKDKVDKHTILIQNELYLKAIAFPTQGIEKTLEFARRYKK